MRVTGKTLVTILEQGNSDETLTIKNLLQRVAQSIVETYTERKRDSEFYAALDILNGLVLAREGGSNTLQRQRLPQNHKLVPRSVTEVLDNRAIIDHLVPECLDDERIARLEGFRAQFEVLDRTTRRANLFNENIDALATNIYAAAGTELDEIALQIEPIMRRNRMVGDALTTLDEYVNGAGRAAADSRRANELRDEKRDAKAAKLDARSGEDKRETERGDAPAVAPTNKPGAGTR